MSWRRFGSALFAFEAGSGREGEPSEHVFSYVCQLTVQSFKTLISRSLYLDEFNPRSLGHSLINEFLLSQLYL